jgi:hypothetical protein
MNKTGAVGETTGIRVSGTNGDPNFATSKHRQLRTPAVTESGTASVPMSESGWHK